MKIEIDERGNIKLNIVDILENMDDDGKQEVIEHFAWQSPIWNEMVRNVCETYAAERFNDSIYRLRLAFFQSEDVPEALRQTIKSLLDTVKHLRDELRAVQNANGQWRSWWYEHRPHESMPVPFPQHELEWTNNKEVYAFMEAAGIEI